MPSRDPVHCVPNPIAKGSSVDRRSFLAMLTALGAGALLNPLIGRAATSTSFDPTPEQLQVFPLGIMSGDPLPDGTIIWTRIEPADEIDPSVLWEVGNDDTFAEIAAGGIVTATADTDYTVKIPVSGLDSDRWYHYRFTVNGVTSIAGRLRTAPMPGVLPERLRFVFSSCQQQNDSYYVAHRAIVEEQADFFMHLGDYIYVSDSQTVSLDDYRGVYKRFRSNPLLQAVHASTPTVAMWDDGEFSNYVNRFFDPDRLDAGARAWGEYMPVATDADDPLRVYRQFAWGALADIFLIDVRTHSDGEVADINSLSTAGAKMMDTSRSLLGADQKNWLKDGMANSSAQWRMIGQGFMMLPWRLLDLDNANLRKLSPKWQRNAGVYAPTSDWDDYQGDRRELLYFLQDNNITNNIFCSGDLHLFFAGVLQPDFDDKTSPVVAFDFCTGSLTADPDPRTLLKGFSPKDAERLIHVAEKYTLGVNKHIDYCNLLDQGYVVVDVMPDAVEVRFRMIDSFDPDAKARDGAAFRILLGTDTIERLS